MFILNFFALIIICLSNNIKCTELEQCTYAIRSPDYDYLYDEFSASEKDIYKGKPKMLSFIKTRDSIF